MITETCQSNINSLYGANLLVIDRKYSWEKLDIFVVLGKDSRVLVIQDKCSTTETCSQSYETANLVMETRAMTWLIVQTSILEASGTTSWVCTTQCIRGVWGVQNMVSMHVGRGSSLKYLALHIMCYEGKGKVGLVQGG